MGDLLKAAPNVWAGVPWNADETVPNPDPTASLPTSMGAAAMPQFSAPSIPNVTKAPNPFDLAPQAQEAQRRLAGDYDKDARPYGFAGDPAKGLAPNHPGVMGHVLHALSVAGNIAGNIVAPMQMAMIPGTQLNRQMDEAGLSAKLQGLAREQSQNEQRDAVTQGEQQKIADDPQEQADTHDLRAAQARLSSDQAGALEHPAQSWKPLAGVLGPNGEPVEVEQRSGQVRFGNVSGLQQMKPPKPDSPEQQYIDEYQRVHPGSSVASAERQYTLDTQRPPQVSPSLMMVPNGAGGYTATVVHPGQSVTPGTMTASQFGSGNAADVKAEKTQEAAAQAQQKELGLMQQLAANPSPTNDAAMLMHYIGATKPESMGKIRLNEKELALFGNTRSSLGDAEALLTKVTNGQSLTPTQRQDMLKTMTMIANASGRGGSAGAAGVIYARDPQGNLHQAPAGTVLPTGWKQENR